MTYLDTGCLVKLYYPEPDSANVIALVQGKSICYTLLHDLEFVNALQLKFFTKNVTAAQVAAAKSWVEADLRQGPLVSPVVNWTEALMEATRLAQRHTGVLGCRSLDILHCALAKILSASEFISSDTRQKRLAVAMGLNLVTF